jgi:hypothetical protein
MVGGVKAVVLLLALVLIAGGAVSYDGPTDNHEPDQHSHSHHDHYQPPPLLEMLPPIGPVGFVLMGVVADLGFGKKEAVAATPTAKAQVKNTPKTEKRGVSTSSMKSKSGVHNKASRLEKPVQRPETGEPRLAFAKQPELKEEGNSYFITGTVQNNSATDTYFRVGVQFLLQDEQGDSLGIVQDNVAFLDPGQTWGFRVLVIDPDATQYVLQGNIGGTR